MEIILAIVICGGIVYFIANKKKSDGSGSGSLKSGDGKTLDKK